MKDIISKAICDHQYAVEILKKESKTIEDIAKIFINTLTRKGKIIFMGNGGSASDAQHLAAELVGRFKKNRPALAAIALTDNASILTAVGNDFSFQDIFVRQIEALANPNDTVVGISTSGMSDNIINAIRKCRELNIDTVGFLGRDGGKMLDILNTALLISHPDTPRIQEAHILAGHIICEIVEEHFLKN
ncbi:MAG: SIS domain-containing protein [Candidatus Omnitrophica bacterium]|jgi:D-sedoheptulose 7-phosphate isomerase|nr:SIS domain-containing protein [Candidatus Omnitrophota bacterium]